MTTVPTLHLPSPDLASRTCALFVQAATPKYGCLMAMLPSLESVIPNWAADNIDAKTLANDGIEHETHCTVLYGWNLGFEASRLKSILAGHPPIVLTVGKLSRFECPDYDVIKFAVESPALVKLNRDLSRQFKHCITASEHKFNAHITAAYVQKGTNLDLTAPRIEGYSTVVQQLLYSLPDEKGRTVFDLGRNTTATLATRIKNLLRATQSPLNAQSQQHAAARSLAQNRYQQAVDDFIAHAKAEAMSRDKKRREKIKALWLLLMLDAGEDAYSLIYPKLAAIATPGTAKLAPPVKSEPADYAASRQTYLDNFSNTVLDRLDAVVQQGAHDAASPREIRRQLDERATELRTGQGEVVAMTESQACYGHAQIRILKRAGFKTALWDQLDRPTKRETHAANMEMGPQPLGTLYPNGQRCPGDPAGGPGECLNCLCTLVGVDRDNSFIKSTHIKEYQRTGSDGKKITVHEHEDKRDKWTGGIGGIHLKRVGADVAGKGGKWVTHEDKEIPEHAKKMVIPPAWKNVRIAPDASHDLQAIGEDSKNRVQRIYSEAATQKSADEKFSRNKELLEKQGYIFKQNEENLKSEHPKIREAAACMKLIQETGIRPGSDNETGAEKQAYGATTLEGRHVIVGPGGHVRLQFVGKKGVDLDIPVTDSATAIMLKERKEKSGDDGKLFGVTDGLLRDYSHTLDGGSFKPKDFRTLKGTNTALEAIKEVKEKPATLKEYKKVVMAIAKKVSEVLGNTPTIALQSYINPFVFDSIKPQDMSV